MSQRRAALKGVDAERGRRERKNNIVNARANAREERLNHVKTEIRARQKEMKRLDERFKELTK